MSAIKRFLPLALGLLLWASPAAAGISQVFGTGTGGNVGTGFATTGPLTINATINTSIPAGAYVAIVGGLRNNGTCSSTIPFDSKGNTYPLIGANQTANSGVYHFAAFITTPLVSGDTVTLTCSTTASKGLVVGAWNGVWTTTPHDATAGNSGGATATSATPGFGPTSTLPCNTIASSINCNLVIMGVASAGNQIYTATDSQLLYMGCGSGTSPSPCMFSRVSSSTTALTVSGNTLNTGASAWADRFDTFNGDGLAPVVANKRLLFHPVP